MDVPSPSPPAPVSARSNGPSRVIRAIGSLLGRPVESLTLAQKLVLSGALVGASAGATAFVFSKLIVLLRSGTLDRGLALPTGPARWALIVVLPAAGALLGAALIAFHCPEAEGHGIAEVSQAVSAPEGRIPGRVAWVKLVASAATIGFGGSAGREGPAIHIGGAVGSWIGQRLHLPPKDVAMLVAAGASAGLAAAFGVPLTAVFFTMEVITKQVASESFVAVVIASVSGAVTASLLFGGAEHTLHQTYALRGPTDFLWFAALALVCAPLGRVYMRAIELVEHRLMPRWWRGKPKWLAPAAGGLLVGLLGLLTPEIMGTGNDFIVSSLNGAGPGGLRAAGLAAAKIVGTAATLGTGGSGGAFMPALFIGMAGAGAFGSLFSGAPAAGALAMGGMACVVTSAYSAPVTGIVMALEMSRDYDILAPIMLACAVAYALTQRPAAREGSRPVVER